MWLVTTVYGKSTCGENAISKGFTCLILCSSPQKDSAGKKAEGGKKSPFSQITNDVPSKVTESKTNISDSASARMQEWNWILAAYISISGTHLHRNIKCWYTIPIASDSRYTTRRKIIVQKRKRTIGKKGRIQQYYVANILCSYRFTSVLLKTTEELFLKLYLRNRFGWPRPLQ